ncbi:MAG: hypothetical protein IKV57_08305 [Clostridia bacterium]|nr:hypothetical protein [Clostridia bacterium]
MDAKTKKFRNAVGGYNKEDVNGFIKEMDLQNSAALAEKDAALQKAAESEAALQQELGSLRENHAALSDTLAAAQTEADGLKRELTEKDAVIEDLQKRLGILRSQTEAQTEAMERLRKEKEIAEKTAADKQEQFDGEKSTLEGKLQESAAALEKLRSDMECRIQELEAALSAAKVRAEEEIERFRTAFTEEEDSTGYKIRMYDKISGQVGDILLDANRNADEILGSAREEAEKLRTETAEEMQKDRTELQAELMRMREENQKEAQSIRDRLSATAETLLSDISGELHVNIDNCIKELAICMTEVEYDAETMLQSMQKRCQEMNDRIHYYQGCVQESIDAKLRNMSQKYGIPETGSVD